LLNHDAVIDLTRLRPTHPLRAWFDVSADSLPLEWSQRGVRRLRWRATATFTILPSSKVRPLVLSPGGRCISLDRPERRVSFESLPIAVAGLHGSGRFALFGGPHAFELGTFGLLGTADNAQFLRNILRWLLGDEPLAPDFACPTPPLTRDWDPQLLHSAPRELADIGSDRSGQTTALYVERLLRRTGMLKALVRAKWVP
jgi:hypothetical protein